MWAAETEGKALVGAGALFWKLGEAKGAGMKGVKRRLSKEQSQGLQDMVG